MTAVVVNLPLIFLSDVTFERCFNSTVRKNPNVRELTLFVNFML
jgi:hypothetical protein